MVPLIIAGSYSPDMAGSYSHACWKANDPNVYPKKNIGGL